MCVFFLESLAGDGEAVEVVPADDREAAAFAAVAQQTVVEHAFSRVVQIVVQEVIPVVVGDVLIGEVRLAGEFLAAAEVPYIDVKGDVVLGVGGDHLV